MGNVFHTLLCTLGRINASLTHRLVPKISPLIGMIHPDIFRLFSKLQYSRTLRLHGIYYITQKIIPTLARVFQLVGIGKATMQ
jgi:hypothetical protein